MANRFPLIANSTDSKIYELPSGDNLDLTGSGIYNGTATITLPSVTSTLATLAGTETLTNKTISGSSNTLSNIGNSSLTNSSVTINGTSVSLGGSITITATATNALTIGTGLSGTSYNGSSAVTIAIDSTVATLTGTQTLTNKTISGSSNTLSNIPNNALTNSSITINGSAISLGGSVSNLALTTGTLAQFAATTSSQLAGVISDETGSGSLVFATSPTLVTPNLGTPSAITLTNATGLPVSTGISGLGTGVATFLATPSSANLAAALTDETGSGSVVFSASPTFTGTANFAAIGTTGNATVGGDLTVTGNLTINGTTTTINATTITVDDKNIELGSTASPSDASADGGGITLKGTTDKTFNWVDATDAWTSSEHIRLAAGKDLILAGSTSGTVALEATATAGTTTIVFPATSGTVITTGDTGTVTSTMIADGTIVNADINASAAIAVSKLAASTISGVTLGNNLNTLTLNTSGTGLSGSTTYNGSGAATFTVTSNATSANTASAIVARDASGNFSAGTITAALSGNATTATTLATARTISLGGDLSGSASFDGSADITITATIASNSVALGTDTTGAYVVDIVAGTGISLTETANNAEGNTVTVTNSGVTSIVAGTGISISGATGAVTINSSVPNASTQVSSLGVGTAASGTTGEIRATNAITSYYSDERLKKDITEITGALDKVMQLKGVTFRANEIAENYGYTSDKEQVGVIAQDVEKVLPQIVVPAPFDLIQLQEGIEISKSGENYKTVHYEKLVPLLIQAIKEQQIMIEELQKKVGI